MHQVEFICIVSNLTISLKTGNGDLVLTGLWRNSYMFEALHLTVCEGKAALPCAARCSVTIHVPF